MTAEKVIEAKNVEQALKKASEKYNIPVGKLKHEVISYGSTGIFGLVGVKKARIKILLPDEKAAAKKESVKASKREATAPPSPRQETTPEPPGKPKAETPPEQVTDWEAEKDAIELGRKALEKIIDSITSDASLEVRVEAEQVLFDITGGKAAVLIGRRGQTLEAMQYLVEKIINRSSVSRVRIQIDVQGYLQNRRSNLEELASRLAEKVQRVGKPVTAGEMNVQDRKIVHMALKDHSHVRTQSVGSGFYRKLMIFPKKNGGKKKSPPSGEN